MNGCIECICYQCGTRFCARGCGYQSDPDPDEVTTDLPEGKIKIDTICPYCGSPDDVYIYHKSKS